MLQGMCDLINNEHEDKAQDECEPNHGFRRGLLVMMMGVLIRGIGRGRRSMGRMFVFVAIRVDGPDALRNDDGQGSAHQEASAEY